MNKKTKFKLADRYLIAAKACTEASIDHLLVGNYKVAVRYIALARKHMSKATKLTTI